VLVLHLLRLAGLQGDRLPEVGPLDNGPLGDAFTDKYFPDDSLPYAGLSDFGLQDRLPQGKVAELRQELNSGGKKDKNHSAKKIALKKIVANMTMSNNDMMALFPDIVNCMQIPSLEIKKMCVLNMSADLIGAKLIRGLGASCTLSITRR
jgi:hypothetical protein